MINHTAPSSVCISLGSIFRKVRAMRGMSASQAGQLAQLPTDEWLRFELGMPTRQPVSYTALLNVALVLRFRISAISIFNA
ncbi:MULTISPECIES: hypothetical protein [Shewanella]|uniref:XRE family transcriptional regulator n=1 Tax=Shewanella carassii TaxID=1987584 RepID=A0ABQ1T0U9_9GAMM|nr:hypothetical protein [Shewanella carassii]GGE76131.1 hypothetical protein GCM10011520_15860 [Shewanella carassii]